MLIKIEELEEGDEILVGARSHINYFIVLKKPSINTKYNRYKSVKVSQCQNIKTHTYQRGGQTYTYNYKTPVCTAENHNVVKYNDLSHKDIWLVKRK